MHQYHSSMWCISTMHQRMHQFHALIPCTNTIHLCRASMSVHQCRVSATCFSALLLTCHALRHAPEPSYCRSLCLCFTFSSPLKGQCHEMDIFWSKHCIQYFLCGRCWFSSPFKSFSLPYTIIITFYLVLWIHLLLLRPSSELSLI
jgi:hypothetical protein